MAETSATHKLHLYAVPDSTNPAGYRLIITDNGGMDESAYKWLKIQTMEVRMDVPAGYNAAAGLTGQLELRIKEVQAEAYREEQQLQQAIHKLNGITFQPAEREQHEPIAEDAQFVDDMDDTPF